MALLIVSTYQRVQCSCGWKLRNEEINDGWETPETLSINDENQNLIDQESQGSSGSSIHFTRKCKLYSGATGALLFLILFSTIVGVFMPRKKNNGKK